MTETRGRRIYPSDDTDIVRFRPGDYGRDPKSGQWYGCTPSGDLGDLSAHDVVEHLDGTITVSPSILVSYDGADDHRRWHGYLESGIWREA